MWKPTAQEGLWFHGGNLPSRGIYSLYLALQLKARLEGLADAGLRKGPGASPGVGRSAGVAAYDGKGRAFDS